MAVIAVAASIAVVAAAAGASRLLTAHTAASSAPALNMNCTLIVPANPLSAQGLATPYQLTATDPAAGPCNEANQNQTAFVQGAFIDPASGQISIYDPLVVDAGTQPAVAPVVPALPAGAVVALWFGYNGNTLSLAGPDQAPPGQASASATAAVSSPAASATSATSVSPSATASGTGAVAPSGSASPTGGTGTPAASSSASGSAAPSSSATASTPAAQAPGSQGTSSPSAPATATVPATAAAAAAADSRAATEAEGSAPLSPNSSADAQFNATLIKLGQSSGTGQPAGGSQHRQATPSASPPATAPAAASASASVPAASSAPTASASASPTGAPATQTSPPVNAGDAPAASANPDAVLQQANCVAGEVVGGQFSSFTQVGACNAVAFFAAANKAIRAGQLRVPRPGTATDGMKCLTTRSFALIDQDQSDNVTTEYLTDANGRTAQDTAANRQAMGAAAVLFNGSDNGLLDFFVDPALGCSPWEVPNLADGGALAPALPLDELQAARYAGGRGNPAALVPLNDPMTLDNNGQSSADKTNTYRSLMDMPALPAGESPRAYCSDMERIQGSRIQQDVNLLTANPGPAPAAADNLFTFLAMRLQQSFANLNCGSFGLQNDVSTTVDGNGVVVAACFLRQVAAVTAGAGNPMAGVTTCPATTAPSSPGATTASPGGAPSTAAAGPTPSATASASAWRRHHLRHHWWW